MANRIKYKKTLKVYAHEYNVSEATLREAIKKGLNPDNAEEARDFLACGKYKVIIPATDDIPKPRKTCKPLKASKSTNSADLGLSHANKRLAEAEREAAKQYHNSLILNNPQKTALLLKSWLALSEALRKAEIASPDVAELNNKSVSVDELEQALGKTFLVFRQELQQLPHRIALELVGKDVIGIREILARETDEIINTLYSCKWLNNSKSE